MTIFKSRPATSNDPEPWVEKSGGRHVANWAGLRTHDPRPEFEPTRDPLPWKCANGDKRFWSRRAAENHCGTDAIYTPRREQFDTPVNPILVEFRKLWKGQPDILEMADHWARFELDGDWESSMTHEYTMDQINHAHRVLTRLAALA